MTDTKSILHAARFSFVVLGLLLFWGFSYFLAIAGAFSLFLLIPFGLVISAGLVMALRKWLSEETSPARVLLIVAIIFSGTVMCFASPTVFSGRDQGSISEAAFELSRTGSLSFSYPASGTFFDIYGEGKALNFPGFYYQGNGSLTTQFPLGYTSWLAAFTSFFGMNGFRVGNGILLALSVVSLFLLVRSLANERYALGASAVFMASFLPSWFAKFTLTENAALFLFLFLSLNLILFLRENRPSFFLGAYLSSLLLSVTRIEGIWALIAALSILFLSRQGREFAAPRKTVFRTMPILFAILTLSVNFLANIPFYTVMAKALLGNLSSLSSADPDTLADSAGISSALWKLFALYGLLPVFLIGLAGILVLIRKRRYLMLVPTLIALPTFIYFVDPNITHDHPWMLRRFLPFIFPTLLLSGTFALSILLSEWKRREAFIAAGICIFAFAAGLPATARTFTFSDNRGFLETTAEIAPFIGENDLLLIDRETTGDPFSMPDGPLRFLYGKNAAYFFNWQDYGKIPKDRYEHIYLLSPLEHFDEWKRMPATFDFVSAFDFSTKQLETVPLRDARFPEKKQVKQNAILFELKPL